MSKSDRARHVCVWVALLANLLCWCLAKDQSPSRLDGAPADSTEAELQAVQKLFDAAVTLADDIYDATHDLEAHIAQLRAALQLCPACPLTVPGVLVAVSCKARNKAFLLDHRQTV